MKLAIIDTYYPRFLEYIRSKDSSLESKSYHQQLDRLLSYYFGTADFYSYNLKKIGHPAEDYIVNDETLQRQWARENNVSISTSLFLSKIQRLPMIYRLLSRPLWLQRIALLQIKKAQPDVVYIQDLFFFNSNMLVKIKQHCRLLVGQIASPLPSEKKLIVFDLILTSFPHYVAELKKREIKSKYFKIGFDERVLKIIGRKKRIYDISFIGSFTSFHRRGTKILQAVAKKVPINIWGQGVSLPLLTSPLGENFHGEVWGLSMYKILAQSKIVINRHIDIAGQFANNMRLYEATGMGALLLTEDKKNLSDLFKIGKEVVAYKDSSDLIEKISYYLEHENERKRIAQAGQKRTLQHHTYKKRMKELIEILDNYL